MTTRNERLLEEIILFLDGHIKNYEDEKDINDMIMSGLTKLELQDIISNNTYSKLSALTKLNYWKKIKEV